MAGSVLNCDSAAGLCVCARERERWRDGYEDQTRGPEHKIHTQHLSKTPDGPQNTRTLNGAQAANSVCTRTAVK